MVSEGALVDLGKTVAVFDGYDVSVNGRYARCYASLAAMSIINLILVHGDLKWRVNGSTTADACVLVHDADDGPALADHVSSTGNNGDIGEGMVVKASDVNKATGGSSGRDDSAVRPLDAPVCSTIDEGTFLGDSGAVHDAIGNARMDHEGRLGAMRDTPKAMQYEEHTKDDCQ